MYKELYCGAVKRNVDLTDENRELKSQLETANTRVKSLQEMLKAEQEAYKTQKERLLRAEQDLGDLKATNEELVAEADRWRREQKQTLDEYRESYTREALLARREEALVQVVKVLSELL